MCVHLAVKMCRIYRHDLDLDDFKNNILQKLLMSRTTRSDIMPPTNIDSYHVSFQMHNILQIRKLATAAACHLLAPLKL